MALNKSTTKFFLILAGFATLLALITFYPTLDVPLSPEDLSVYLGYFYFTGDYNIPKCFYWNSFGVLPGEFVYKFGFDIKDIGGSYRPLTTLVFALNFIISGFNPATYHITNILLHLITSILVGYLVFLMTRRYSLSAFASIFFLMNPLHAEQTIVIIQVSDILCTLFYTLGFIFFYHYIQSEKKKFLTLAIISFLLSIMGKEMCVTFPLMLTISYPLLFKKVTFKLDYLRNVIKKVGLFWVVLIAYLIFRILIFGSIGGYPGIYASHDNPISPHTKFGWFVIYNIAEGINKLFLIPGELLPSRYMWLTILILSLFLPIPRRIKFSVLWIFVSVAPIANLYLMPWYLYLPSVGFTAAIAMSIGVIIDLFPKTAGAEPSEKEGFQPIRLAKNPVLIIFFILSVGLFFLFHGRIWKKIEKFRKTAEYSYIVKDQFKKLQPDFPKGSNIYFIVNSMTNTGDKIDYNPALQYVMRIAYNDLHLNLIPIPLDTEFEYFLELNKAAILDITTIKIDDKTYFFDYTNWKLTRRDDILDGLKLKEELKKSKNPDAPIFFWDFDATGQYTPWKTYPEGVSLASTGGVAVPGASNKPIDIRSSFETFDSIFVDEVVITLKIESPNPSQAYLYWKNEDDKDYSENKKRTFTINPGNDFSTIPIPVIKDISWLMDRDVKELRLLFPPPIHKVTIKRIQLY